MFEEFGEIRRIGAPYDDNLEISLNSLAVNGRCKLFPQMAGMSPCYRLLYNSLHLLFKSNTFQWATAGSAKSLLQTLLLPY